LNLVPVPRVFLDLDIHPVHVSGRIFEGDVELALKNALRNGAADVYSFGYGQDVLR
jgi:hypothetical protein